MLIRLVSHHVDNSDHIDKLIYIEGLPDSMFFQVENGKKYLKEPWEPDTERNIPDGIRRVFFKNPQEVWVKLPYDPQAQKDSLREYSVTVNAFKIDYQNLKGEQMWGQIEKILDRETPRDQEVPVPAVVGDRLNWTLEASDVPAIVLTKQAIVPVPKIDVPLATESVPEETEKSFKCDECNRSFASGFGLKTHVRKAHKEKQAVRTA